MTKKHYPNWQLQVSIRLRPEDFARLDAQALRLSTLWCEATQSDVVRAAILKGLAVMEREAEELPLN
jgi:predicted DNA-binding protein